MDARRAGVRAGRRQPSVGDHRAGRATPRARLRQSQKLEAIGQLAGGVAHDFNNILTVVLGRTEEVARTTPPAAGAAEAIAEIAQNAQRDRADVRQLLAFSRRQAMQVVDVDMNVVVGNLTRAC